jgi:hypothetical protein
MHGEDCAAIANDHSTHGLATLNALDDVKVHPTPQPAALSRTDEPSIHDVIEPPARLHATANLFLHEPLCHFGVSHPKLRVRTNQSSFAKA